MRKTSSWIQRSLLGMGLLGLMVLSTCSVNQVGLGAKVDITPPKVAITSPAEEGQYTRGNVALAGTVSDDISLSSVTVSYAKASGGSANDTATVTGNAWALTIPSGTADGIAEGKQTITVSATDASGKVASDTLLVYIDNETPTVLVTYPLTRGKASEQPPQSTETLDIKGEVSDASPVVSVEVAVVDAGGTPIGTKNSTLNPNPKTADGTNTWSARFFLKDSSKGLNVTDGGEYFYRVTAIDQAGNSNQWYYHVFDIPSLMPDLDTLTPEREIGPLPTVSELGDLDHGSTGTASTPTGILYDDFVQTRLSGTQLGNFRFVATAVPSIRFSNLDQTKAQNENLLGPGGVVTGTIAPPVSAPSAIEKASLSVKLSKGLKGEETLLRTYTFTDTENLQLTELGDSLGFTIPLKDGSTELLAGPYSLTISAKAATSSMWSETVAFFLDSGAPTLTSNQPTPFVRSPIELKGDASSNLELSRVEVYETKNGVVMDRLPDVSLTGNSAPWTTGLTLPQNKKGGLTDGSPDGSYDYELRLVSVSGKKTSVYRSFTYDTITPTTEVQLSPLAGTSTVNGTVTMNGQAIDLNGLSQVRWAIRPTSGGAPTWTDADSQVLANPPYTASIDTTNLTDEQDYTLWFRALDKAANPGVASKNVRVSQASDRPSFSYSNLDASVTGAGFAVAKANLVQNGAKLLAIVSDDDAIDASTIRVRLDGGAWTAVTKAGPSGAQVSVEHDLTSLADGVHTVALQAADQSGVSWTSPTVSFVVDTTPPVVEVNNNNGWYKDTITLTGTASDTNGMAASGAVVLTLDDAVDVASRTKVTATIDASGNWTSGAVALPAGQFGDGPHTWSVTATDAVGKAATKAVTFQIDRTPPTLSVNNLNSGDLVTSASFTVLGSASDDGSGIARVETKLGSTWTTASGTTSWSQTLSGLNQSLNTTFELRAVDVAGNTSTPVTVRNFAVDFANPTLTETGVNTTELVGRNTTVVLGGSVSDANGILSLAIDAVVDGNSQGTVYTDSSGGATWTYTLPGTDGTYELTITATDKVGRKTTLVRRILFDKTSPELNILFPAADEFVDTATVTIRGNTSDDGIGVKVLEYSLNSTDGTNGTWTALTPKLSWSQAGVTLGGEGAKTLWVRAGDGLNPKTAKSVAFSHDLAPPTVAESTSGLTSAPVNRSVAVNLGGSVADSNGIQTLTVTSSKNGAAATTVTPTFVTQTTAQNWTWGWTLPNTEEGTFTIKVSATDAAGRTSNVETRTITIDTTAPTVDITAPDTDGAWFSTSSVTLRGTAADEGTGVRALYYALTSSAPTVPADPTQDTWAGWTKVTGSTASWSLALSGLSEGSGKSYTFRAADQTGNVSPAEIRVFGVDTAKPTLTGVSTPAANTNLGYQISGTAADTVGVATVVVTQTKNGGSVVTMPDTLVTNGTTNQAWTLTNLPRNPASPAVQATLDASNDGVYEYQITVTDLAGKTEVVTRTVRFDATVPTVTIQGLAFDGTSNVASSSYSFGGTSLDASGSGVASIEYSLNNGSTWSSYASAVGTSSWSFNIANMATTFGAEGIKGLRVRATDNAGNTSTPSTIADQLNFVFDTAVPLVTVSGAATRDTKTAFSLTGTASDAYGVASITIKQNGTTITTNPATGTSAWTLANLPREGVGLGSPQAVLTDGTYTYDVTATDLAGKTSLVASVTVRIDQTAPETLTIVDPASGLTGVNSLTGKTNLLKGTVSDAGVGTGKIWYAITSSATPPAIDAFPTDPVGYTAVTTGNGNWSFTDSNRNEGSYFLHVLAEDTAGNRSAAAITRAFDIDVASPVLTESTIGNSVLNTKVGFSIAGTWTESHGVQSFTVTQSKDGGAAVPLTSNFTTTSSWSLTGLPRNPADQSTTLLDDGLYEYVFSITDLAGKTSSLTRTIRFDATAPVLTITSPSEGSWSNNASVTITGVTTDGSGSGITSVQYSSDGTNYSAVGGSLSSWTVPLTGLTQGSKVYYFRATDATANVSTPLVLNFGVDTAVPSVPTETTSPALTLSKVAFALGGALADTNALANVTVTQNKDSGGAVELLNTAKSGTADTWALSGLPRDPAIQANTLVADGSYEYVITVTDAAGKTASLTRTVRIDTTGPSVTIDDPGLYLSGNAGSLFGLADDGTGSGIDKVQYSLTSATGPWTDATGKNNWLVSLNLDTDGVGVDTGLAEGPYTLYVQALDKAGNATTVVGSQAFEVDQAAPALTLYKVDGDDFIADTIYGNTTLALSGTAVDSYGVQSVAVSQFKSGGSTDALTVTLNPGTTSRTWTTSADLGQGEGTYTITVTITDLVGRQTNIQKTVIKDTQAPSTPAVTTPAAANQWLSGASFNFAGTATDVGTAGIAAVYYGFGAPGLTPTTDLEDPFWTQASGTTSWSALVNLTGEGARSLYLKAVDRAGNVSTLQTFLYGIDQSNPSLSYLLPSGNFINGNLTLSGTASDTNAVSSVAILEKKPGDVSFNFLGNANYNSGDGTWSYLHLLSAFDALADGVYEYRITVTDAAGKATSYDKTITQDFLSPAVTLNAPTPTIGGPGTYQVNGTLSLGGTISDLNGLDALEIRIGAGAWAPLGTAPFTSFATNLDTTALTDDADVTVSIRATDKAGNLGTSNYTLHVDQDTDKPVVVITGPAAAENVQSANISMTGTISDDEGVDTGAVQYRISYNGGTDWTAWTAIPAGNLSGAPTSKSFTFNLNDPSNGSKILQIRAADTGAVVGDAASVTFTQDTGAPVLSSITPTEATVTNAASFVVAGTATDSATVQSVTYRVLRDGIEIVATAPTALGGDTDPGVGETRTFTSPAISTASGTGNYQVQLISSDGTNTRQETINVVVDKTAPTVAFSSPSASSTQNNVITLTGTASDNRLLSSVAVEIWKGGSKVADAPGTVLGTSNWSLSFNTADFDDNTNATFFSGTAYDITLRATATDSIGNVGSSTDLTFRIDQATDSPVIAVSTAQSPTYLSAFTVNGTADDDDGISLIEVSADGSSWTTVTAPGGGWTKNSSWNTTLTAGDGAKTLYVRVTDTSTPGIVTTSPVFNFRVDQESPEGTFTSPAVNTKLKAGEFAFTGTFADESGVSNVQLKVDSGDFSSGDVKTATFTPGTSGGWSYTFASGDVADGVRTIYLQVTDAAGKTSNVTRAVTVDKTAPVVTVTEPANASSAFGLVRLRGSAVDATSGVRSIKVGLGKTINTADWDNVSNTWYTATGTVSWEYVITNINNYANTTFATDLGDTDEDGVVDGGETWQGIWRIYLYVRSEDTAGLGPVGNVSVVDTFYLEVDPLRDRPEITVLQPVDATSTVGGFLRIVGSAYDTNFIAKNQIAFDMNNDGDFNDPTDVWPSAAGFTPPSTDSLLGTDVNTTSWYAMAGTTSWSAVINNSGEFNPTGGDTTKTIKFKVRSVDSKVAHGGTPSLAGLESVFTVTFSNQVPQYSNINLATGDTIGGTVVLTGYVKVPSAVGMDSIRFNHDGPRLSSTELLGGPAGMRAVLLLNGDPQYEATYDKYAIEATINTNDVDLFPNNAGSMTVSLRAYDNSAFQSFQTISLTVDNKAPTAPSFTNLTEIAGTAALIQGAATDTGVVSGVKKVVFYLQKGSNVYRLKGTSIAVAPITGDPLTNAGNEVLDLNNTAYNDYRIIIDKTTEGGSDAGAGGDNDGFNESLSSSFGVYTWNAAFNSTLTADGTYDAKFTAYDVGNNATAYTQSTFVANNKPVITSIVLATDLNGDGDVADAGEASSNISANYATTSYTGRGNRLGITVNTTGGNGTKRYSVLYNAVEQNSVLTSNTLVIDTSGITDSAVANDRVFTILVFDSTTSDDTSATGELTSTITVGVTIDNVDGVAPTVQIAPFGQKYSVGDADGTKTLGAVAAYSDNIKLSGQTLLGHVEYASDSLHDGADTDVSGEVIFKGKVGDNQRINRITATIPGFNGGAGVGTAFNLYTFAGGALSGTGWAFTTEGSNYLTEANGNVFNWNFTWNSSLISTVAANNVTVTITVYDANGTPNTATNALTVDVVPYISKVTTLLSNLNVNNPSVYNRTALGKYPVSTTETIKLTGFNLTDAAGTTPVVTITGIAAGITATGGVVSVPMTSASSGNLPLTVNSVPLLNNVNSNSVDYNKLPNNVNNQLLTDDVNLDVWQFNSQAAVPISGQISDPVMKINPVTGKVGFAFTNGPLYFSMGGNAGGTDYSYQYWQASFDFLTSVSFAYDAAGRSYGTAAGGDINANSADKFGFMSDRWGVSGLTQTGSYNGINSLRLESIGLNIGGVNEFDKYRIKSPQIVTSRLATGAYSTNIYMAYFDNMTSEIAFRYGNLPDTATAKANFSALGNTVTAGSFVVGRTYTIATVGSTTFTNIGASANTVGTVFTATGVGTGTGTAFTNISGTASVNAGAFQVGKTYTIVRVGTTTFTNIGAAANTVGTVFTATGAGTGTGIATPVGDFFDSDTGGAPQAYSNAYKSIVAGSTTGRNAGEYVSIAVIPGATVTTDIVVMVWYDATNQSLWYSYNTTPTVHRAGTATAAGWSTPMQIFTNAGEYAQVAIDAGGGVHIAAYDIANASLVYAHLSSYNAASASTSVVDSFGIVGTNITLDVASNGTNYIPYIGYYAPSTIKPKYAYLVDTATSAPNGAVSDNFTGAWEVSLLPTGSSVPQDRINVGVWKTGAGVLSNSVTGTSGTNKTGTGYGATNNGQVYGNGTSNGLLAYQVRVSTNGYIETAQKK